MPVPAALVGVAGPGAIAAAKQMAFHAAAYVDLYAFTSATFAALIARMAWKRIPDWIKEDISFKSLLYYRKRRSLFLGEEMQTDIPRCCIGIKGFCDVL